MTETAPPRLIVKIGSAGDVHVNFKSSTLEQMQEAVTRINQAGGIVVYYAESPYQKSSEASMATFKKLIELKPRILMGTGAVSEWGRLDWVEVQRNPVVSRLFFGRRERFLLLPAPTPGEPKQGVLIGGPLSASNEDTYFKAMDLVIRCARVLETPQHAPELAMDDTAVATPSLHIRLAHAARRWASAYPIDMIPSNIASFERDLWWLASQTFANLRKDAQPVSGQQALDLFEDRKQR